MIRTSFHPQGWDHLSIWIMRLTERDMKLLMLDTYFRRWTTVRTALGSVLRSISRCSLLFATASTPRSARRWKRNPRNSSRNAWRSTRRTRFMSARFHEHARWYYDIDRQLTPTRSRWCATAWTDGYAWSGDGLSPWFPIIPAFKCCSDIWARQVAMWDDM